MVLKRRLDYEFNGYEFPPVPRAARSARRRVPFKKRFQENQMCAFDLLAVVAGKLLLEKDTALESSNIEPIDESAVNKVREIEGKNSEAKVHDQGSPARSVFVSELLHVVPEEDHCHKEPLCCENDNNAGLLSPAATSGCKEKFYGDKVVNREIKNAIGTFSPSKVEVGFSGNIDDSIDTKVDVKVEHDLKDESYKSEKLENETAGGMFSSDSTLCADHIPHCFNPANEDVVNIVSSRDDDENSSGCTEPSTMKRFFRRTPRIGDRRIKKILASRCWKVASRLKDASFSNRQGDLKPFYHTGKNYKLDRSERLYPIKKRRRFSSSLPSNSGGMIYTDLAQKGCNGDGSANGSLESSSSAGKQGSFQPRDSQVKLRIKSFRVPELFIEIPETATIGSLKRTVVDAFTAILGGGVRVGVLLHGRKVREDHKTLLQTGISHSNHSDALGFSLEPNPLRSNGSVCSGDLNTAVSYQTPQPLSRYPHTPSTVHQGTGNASPEPQTVILGNLVESDHDSAPSPTDNIIAGISSDLKDMLAVPAMNAAAGSLAVVSANRKSKRAEMAQRRIRRPFSVSEVEALVQAVEQLGTGRWRDVKVRAFDHAKHRTYVDLKASFLMLFDPSFISFHHIACSLDTNLGNLESVRIKSKPRRRGMRNEDKWKTLVHTARISPQQRRGEAVPQELLDRVLTAHAYWSHQQQLNQQQLSDSCTFPAPLLAMP
ncbi:unnamed protein product [Linum tenue]|uniref:Myb-like domain-containing protein n=1 Tax=Linum tenue TaxID=586396 RepID=A0AAV0Q4L5_9ROSI|nr:unnamed protein product [Linum tenue]